METWCCWQGKIRHDARVCRVNGTKPLLVMLHYSSQLICHSRMHCLQCQSSFLPVPSIQHSYGSVVAARCSHQQSNKRYQKYLAGLVQPGRHTDRQVHSCKTQEARCHIRCRLQAQGPGQQAIVLTVECLQWGKGAFRPCPARQTHRQTCTWLLVYLHWMPVVDGQGLQALPSQAGRSTDRQTHIQTDRRTDRQSDRHRRTDRQTGT